MAFVFIEYTKIIDHKFDRTFVLILLTVVYETLPISINMFLYMRTVTCSHVGKIRATLLDSNIYIKVASSN